MSGVYQSSIQSYSGVYRQDSNGTLKQATEKYFANDHTGQRHGKINQEQAFPDKNNTITRGA